MSWMASLCVTQQPQVPSTYRKLRRGGSRPTFTLGRERAEVRSQGRPLQLWVGEVEPESKRSMGILCPFQGPQESGLPAPSISTQGGSFLFSHPPFFPDLKPKVKIRVT